MRVDLPIALLAGGGLRPKPKLPTSPFFGQSI
jgi:hypothetical protein